MFLALLSRTLSHNPHSCVLSRLIEAFLHRYLWLRMVFCYVLSHGKRCLLRSAGAATTTDTSPHLDVRKNVAAYSMVVIVLKEIISYVNY